MRLTRTPIATLTVAAALTPALVALPTVAGPTARPHRVPPRVVSLDLRRLDPARFAALPPFRTAAASVLTADRLLGRAPAVLTDEVRTGPFDLVAVSWSRPVAGTSVQVRVRESGRWTDWQRLGNDDDGPDRPGSGGPASGRPGATAPLLTAGADGVQVRVDTPSGAVPPGLAVDLVDGGSSAADAGPAAPSASAEAATGSAGAQPPIITRAQWGADESLVSGTTSYDSAVKALFVHHTDTTNSYSPAQAYAQVRAIYAFHTQVRGWNDIGYNFLVDRFGRVFEGRRGSIDQAVVGAHTGGFNSQSLGVAVLGTFSQQAPSSAALHGLVDVLAWKSAQYQLDPRASTRLTSAGGPFTAHPAGERVRVATLSSHRDVGITECPGNALWADLPWLRRQVAARLVPGLVAPAVSATTAVWGGTGVQVTGTVPTTQRWTLTATSACGTAPVRVLAGTATGRITARWDLRDATGTPVAPGLYRLTLATRSPVGAAPTWARDVEVLPAEAGPAGTCPVRRVTADDADDAAARTVAVGRIVAPTASTVVLAGLDAAGTDGVVAAPLAHALHAPLLLTDPATLSPSVAADLSARHATRVIAVGGTGSVGPAVLDRLRALGVTTVDRIAGPTPAATAAAVARALVAVPRPPGTALPDTALLASARTGSLADVATLGAVAAGTGRPILLVAPGGIPTVTLDALRALRISRAVVAAGPADVPRASLRSLAGAGIRRWTRAVGTGRAGTALVLAGTLPPDPPTAPGDAWAAGAGDAALPDVVAADAAGRPVLLLPAVVTAGIGAWFTSAHPARTWVLGGTAQVPTSLVAALSEVAR